MNVYTVIFYLLSPGLWLVLLARLLTGKETWRGVKERLGLSQAPQNAHRAIWVHGASLGEITAARPLITQLCDLAWDLHVIVTVNTYTARAMVLGWNDPKISVQMAPLEFPGALTRFCDTWAPKLAITLENEIWPKRLATCQDRDIPVLALAARISESSARKWLYLPTFAQHVFAAITAVAPMDGANAARFQRLGVPSDKILPPLNLKSSVELAPPDARDLAAFQSIYPYDRTVLAASTHDEDEELILSAFQIARTKLPDLKLIIAVRHPHRCDAVAIKIADQALPFLTRRNRSHPPQSTPILLAGTLGEMPLWYSLAKATIIGGTFGKRGGHTPIEPVQFGSSVIHGPDVANQQKAFDVLTSNNAAICVETAENLADAIVSALKNESHAAERARARGSIARLRTEMSDLSEILKTVKDLM